MSGINLEDPVTLDGRKGGDGKTSIDIFLSQSTFVTKDDPTMPYPDLSPRYPPAMVAQVYDGDNQLTGFALFGAETARELRDQLDAFLSEYDKEMLTIECWSNNNANIHSQRKDSFEIKREEWEGMTPQERHEYVREHLAQNEHFDYGYDDPLEEA